MHAPRQQIVTFVEGVHRVWDHLRMNPDDDPEARIRALEQPLADTARATELGTGATPYTAPDQAYAPPPLPPMPPQAQGPYNQGPYTPPGYGAPWAPPPQRKSSAGIPWAVFAGIAVFFLIVAAGVGFVIVNRVSRDISSFPDISIPSVPSIPSMPGISTLPSAPTAAPPGESIGVSGMGQNKTLECNDNYATVSGMGNTVTITGHCTTVVVSGMQNKVTLDSSDEINASGANNVITYHSGSPVIHNGGDNQVQQG
jgi:hypothetical protein